ncbi:hypothetical protein EIN_462100 [Entamoeba invadens IP1]|uniref:MULE transposase domain-containing protein n=1 Tax=Entamoeba invadens IP1 TaxID=370355 RepID=A0A0A1UC82_ENTIV|nr:hypothetical protein EIN_462100 [Entamoeba invadens IP1]ELP89874.1 hypothetical protein EIN_462100 [Entamoeba invadens IP1]|eukprot:XP_004256645.1 hypothetical protein EIN_462100 [Entamoeba invadens IP1]
MIPLIKHEIRGVEGIDTPPQIIDNICKTKFVINTVTEQMKESSLISAGGVQYSLFKAKHTDVNKHIQYFGCYSTKLYTYAKGGMRPAQICSQMGLSVNTKRIRKITRDVYDIRNTEEAKKLTIYCDDDLNDFSTRIIKNSSGQFEACFILNTKHVNHTPEIIYIDDTATTNHFNFPLVVGNFSDQWNNTHILFFAIMRNRITSSFVDLFNFLKNKKIVFKIVFCDRCISQMKAIKIVFPFSKLFHCVRHIHRDLQISFGKTSPIVSDFDEMIHGKITEVDFINRLIYMSGYNLTDAQKEEAQQMFEESKELGGDLTNDEAVFYLETLEEIKELRKTEKIVKITKSDKIQVITNLIEQRDSWLPSVVLMNTQTQTTNRIEGYFGNFKQKMGNKIASLVEIATTIVTDSRRFDLNGRQDLILDTQTAELLIPPNILPLFPAIVVNKMCKLYRNINTIVAPPLNGDCSESRCCCTIFNIDRIPCIHMIKYCSERSIYPIPTTAFARDILIDSSYKNTTHEKVIKKDDKEQQPTSHNDIHNNLDEVVPLIKRNEFVRNRFYSFIGHCQEQPTTKEISQQSTNETHDTTLETITTTVASRVSSVSRQSSFSTNLKDPRRQQYTGICPRKMVDYKESKVAHVRTCSVCKMVGHNKQNCPSKKNIED